MANTKPPTQQSPPRQCTGNANPPTQQFVDDFCNLQKEAKAKKKAAKTSYKATQTVQQYKRCTVEKIRRTAKMYRNLDYCVATSVFQTTEIIKVNVKKYVEKDKELGEQLKLAVKALKEANKKLNDAEAAAYATVDSYEDAENTDSRAALNSVKERIKALGDRADKCNDHIDRTVNNAVLISGIRTFSYVAELDGFAQQLTSVVTKFKEDVDKNNKQAVDTLKTAQEDYGTAIREAVKKQLDWFETCNTHDGVGDTLAFICKPVLPADSLKEICDKVQHTFDHDKPVAAPIQAQAYTSDSTNDDNE